MMASGMHQPQGRTMPDGVLKLHRGATFGEVSNAALPAITGGIRAIRPNGTHGAIRYLDIGCGAYSAEGSGRGGARNRADRLSYHPTAGQIANLTAGSAHAVAIGLPFNRMITVHWEAAGVALADMARATGKYLDMLSKAIARHSQLRPGDCTAWLWMHENGPGKGGHCHMLAHVPPSLVPTIAKLQRRWLRSITGNPYRKGVIRSDPIGGWLGMETSNPAGHAVNLANALAYVCKSAPQAILASHGMQRRHEPGGPIIGKRCGISQNIGPKARKEKT